jgi:hypothetical protein
VRDARSVSLTHSLTHSARLPALLRAPEEESPLPPLRSPFGGGACRSERRTALAITKRFQPSAAKCGECGRQTPHMRLRNGFNRVRPSAASADGRRRTCDYETIKPFASTQTITFKKTSPEAHFFGRNAQDRNRECGRVRRVRLAVPSLEKFI